MSWRLVVNGPRLTQETSTLYNPRIKYCHAPCRKSANWNGYFNRFACIQLHLYPETTTSPSCLPLLVLVECVGLPSSSLTFISAGSNSLLNFSHLWKKMAFKWSPRLNTRLPFFCMFEFIFIALYVNTTWNQSLHPWIANSQRNDLFTSRYRVVEFLFQEFT